MQLTANDTNNSSFQSSTLIQIYSDDNGGGEDDGQIVIKDEHNNSITYNYIFCDDDGDGLGGHNAEALRHERPQAESNYYDLADDPDQESASESEDNLRVVDDLVDLDASFASLDNVKSPFFSHPTFSCHLMSNPTTPIWPLLIRLISSNHSRSE